MPSVIVKTDLKQRLKLRQNVSRRALSLKTSKCLVGSDNLDKLICQIILAAQHPAVDSDTRPDLRWWNRQDGDDHPLGTSVFYRDSHDFHIILRDFSEDGEALRSRQRLPILLPRRFLLLHSTVNTKRLSRCANPKVRKRKGITHFAFLLILCIHQKHLETLSTNVRLPMPTTSVLAFCWDIIGFWLLLVCIGVVRRAIADALRERVDRG
jgi:hypothetical protein